MESAPEKVIIADAQAVDTQGVMAIYKGMTFQRIELAKVRQAFQITSRRILQSSDTSHQGGMQRAQLDPSFRETAAAKPVSLPSLSTGTAIKDLVAKTCSLDPESISADSSLEALGIDSLMMMELESQLLEFNPQVTVSALSQCKTVADIEIICGHKEAHEPATAHAVAFQDSDTEDSISTPSDQSILARTIIAETCGANAQSITASSELQALGIDSLMIFELESRLLEICQSRHLSSSELSGCRTVGDVEKLVGAVTSI
jgi:acyl carrier protein